MELANISRRSFLKGLAALAVTAGLKLSAFSGTRQPYVEVGDIVNFIGPSPGFIGGQLVVKVLPFDGTGYPVVTLENGFCNPSVEGTYYDIDLANFHKEIPADFWHDKANSIYPNVHTWLRMKRYGETIKEAILRLNFASSTEWLSRI